MMKKQVYLTGRVMKHQVAAAMQKLPTDKNMKKDGRGTSTEVTTEDGKICMVKWYDNKPVLMMSAVHAGEPRIHLPEMGQETETICDHLVTKYYL